MTDRTLANEWNEIKMTVFKDLEHPRYLPAFKDTFYAGAMITKKIMIEINRKYHDNSAGYEAAVERLFNEIDEFSLDILTKGLRIQ